MSLSSTTWIAHVLQFLLAALRGDDDLLQRRLILRMERRAGDDQGGQERLAQADDETVANRLHGPLPGVG
jgi:hypothetical protein